MIFGYVKKRVIEGMRLILNVKTLKELIINIILFLFSNFCFIITIFFLLQTVQYLIIGNKFYSTDLKFMTNSKSKELSTFFSFNKEVNQECLIYFKEKKCLKNNFFSKSLDFNFGKKLYEIEFDIDLDFVDKPENFVYYLKFFFSKKNQENNIEIEDFVILQKKNYFLKIFHDFFFGKNEKVLSKKILIDLRHKEKLYGILKLKMLKNQTFIKDIIIRVNEKTNFFVHFYNNYKYFIFFCLFIFCLVSANIGYFLLVTLFYCFRISLKVTEEQIEEKKDLKENKNNNEEVPTKGFIKKLFEKVFLE